MAVAGHCGGHPPGDLGFSHGLVAVVKLRQGAEGAACVLCGRQDGTTVLHHVRVGNEGMGRKPPDHHGIELCHACHAYVHGEGIGDHKAMLLAYIRQIDRWLASGVITIP